MAKKLLQIDFRAKIILVMVPITVVVFAALGYYIYSNQAAAYEADGIFRSKEYVKTYANEMTKEFTVYMETAKNLNTTFSSFQDIDIAARRNFYKNYIENLLKKSPHVVACWADFDRNAIDARDEQFRNVDIWPASGRFFVLNYHDDNGKSTFQPPNPKDPVEGWLGDEWLKAPREKKKLIMTEPFYWSYTNNPDQMQLVSTIAVPIFNRQNQVVGASGTDIPLQFLVDYLGKIKPFGDGYAMLYSNLGKCLSHPNTDLLDKEISANPAFPKDIQAEVTSKLASKKDFYVDFQSAQDGERLMAFFHPLEVPNTDAIMMTAIVVPYESMIAHAEAAIALIVGAFSIAILIIAVLIISVVSGMTGPLRHLFKFTSDYLDRISRGDIPELIDESKYSADFLAVIHSLNAAGAAIESLTHTTQKLLNQALDGDLHARIDATKFQGDYKELMEGINELVNAFAEPLAIVCQFMKGLAAGDANVETFTKKYKGDFATLAGAVNATNTTLDTILGEIVRIAHEAEDGHLSARADITKVQGAWRNILESLNTIVGSADTITKDAHKVLATMATGNLTPRITSEYRGDFKDMKDSINNLGDSLTNLVKQLKDAVHTTASASAEISATAESLAASTQEQSSQANEVAVAMGQMSRTVTDNAHSVARTADVAKRSGEIAATGGQVVEQTASKMKQIADVVKISSNNIIKLGESSKRIGEIISVIDDIADQTNLLSLNAAIEAARAGEQGRGFAVVADSVGKLAISTASATKEIAEMIKGIQRDTEAAVTAMAQGTAEVQSGIELADNTNHSIKDILDGINELLGMINQVAAASEEQSATSEEISRNVSSISKATADSAHNIEDVATTANDLARMTETLTGLVANFTV